jgi:hypothetical protein
MKKEINIKDLVWIHIGERKLSKGRVVEIIDLEHLNEGHSKDNELYVIELKTSIEDIYEVRTFDTISLDPRGPINLFKKQDTHLEQRFLKKVGMIMPNAEGVIPADDYVEGADLEEPTPEQIHAAMERSQLSVQHEPLSAVKKPKKFYAKRTKKS